MGAQNASSMQPLMRLEGDRKPGAIMGNLFHPQSLVCRRIRPLEVTALSLCQILNKSNYLKIYNKKKRQKGCIKKNINIHIKVYDFFKSDIVLFLYYLDTDRYNHLKIFIIMDIV